MELKNKEQGSKRGGEDDEDNEEGDGDAKLFDKSKKKKGFAHHKGF